VNKENQKKHDLRERLSLRAKVKNILEEISWLRTIIYSDLVWGVVFTALIVVILLPVQPMQEQKYLVGDIAKERIVAPQDMSVPDLVSTNQRRQKQLENVRRAYIFNGDQWTNFEARLNDLFRVIGEEILNWSTEHRPGSEAPLPSRSDTEWLVENDEFINGLFDRLTAENTMPVQKEVLRVLVRNYFVPEFQSNVVSILTGVMKIPIISAAETPPRGTAYDITSEKNEPLPAGTVLVSIQEAKQQLLDLAEKNLMMLQVSIQWRTVAEWLRELVEPTARVDEKRMAARIEEASEAATVYFNIKRGEKIVDAGERITEDILAKINYLTDSRRLGLDYLSRTLSISFFTAFLLYSISKFGQYYRKRRRVGFHMFLLVCLTLAINLIVLRLVAMIADSLSAYFTAPGFQNAASYYWSIPFPAGTMLIALLGGYEIALIFSIVLVILSAFFFGGNFPLLLYALIGCLTVIYGLRQYKERTAIIKTGIALGLMNVITIMALSLFEGTFGNTQALLIDLPFGFAGGLLTAVVASFTLPVLESIFGIATEIKLLELSNHEHPLLRDLFMNAPGTFQHSIVVGYLAEAAASAIGANALFCRVACLYHDIGKMLKPDYYVENTDDLGYKHKHLSPNMSALIIINHVKEGMELARRHRLPESVIDIIPQHHGTKIIRYFYEKARRQHKPELGEVKEDDFRYPGPKPQTREAGIIMLADGVDAAARTIEDPSPGRLKGVIKTIIDGTFIDGQLDECDLTLRDLNKCSEAFLRVLHSVHHDRIKYPGVELERQTGRKRARGSGDEHSVEINAAETLRLEPEAKLEGGTSGSIQAAENKADKREESSGMNGSGKNP
jgi:putative nucleotidyltransferase with HDIG domain